MSPINRSLLRWAAPLWLAVGLLPLALAAGEGPAVVNADFNRLGHQTFPFSAGARRSVSPLA